MRMKAVRRRLGVVVMAGIHLFYCSFFIVPLYGAEPEVYRTVYVAPGPYGSDASGDGSRERPYGSAQAAVNLLKRVYATTRWRSGHPEQPGRIVALGEVRTAARIGIDGDCPPVILDGGTGAGKLTLGDGVRGSLLAVGRGGRAALRNITVQGARDNNAPLVTVDGGSLILDAGALITGNSSSGGNGGGVYVANGGTLAMRAGSRISGNRVSGSFGGPGGNGGGGVYADYGTAFTMTGGAISENRAESGRGQGLYAWYSRVVKTGGGY
jgi:hypothetical protein